MAAWTQGRACPSANTIMKIFLDNLSKFIASFFGVGFIPLIPGTFGSAAGVIIYCFLSQKEPPVFYDVLFILIIAGFIDCGRAERAFGKKDPRRIVIDEVSGMLVALMLVPFSLANIIIVFTLFRVFDVLKPYPLRRLEKIPAGFGIMLDDIAAGLYANLIFHTVISFASYRSL